MTSVRQARPIGEPQGPAAGRDDWYHDPGDEARLIFVLCALALCFIAMMAL
jgi:hypothetical protein